MSSRCIYCSVGGSSSFLSSILSAQKSSTLFLIFSFSCLQSFCHWRSSCISPCLLTRKPLQWDWITRAASSADHIRERGSGGLGLQTSQVLLWLNIAVRLFRKVGAKYVEIIFVSNSIINHVLYTIVVHFDQLVWKGIWYWQEHLCHQWAHIMKLQKQRVKSCPTIGMTGRKQLQS